MRSSARKSGKRSVESASSTTPSVTSGKSCPLATIWVPTRTPAGACSKRRSTAANPPSAPAASASSRNTGSGATSASSSRSSCSVPTPWRATDTDAQSGHTDGTGSRWPQWWQAISPAAWWSTSVTSQSGQSQVRAHSRQERKLDQPRRLRSTIAFSPARRTWSSASRVRWWRAPSAPAMPTSSTGGSGRPSTRSGSSIRS